MPTFLKGFVLFAAMFFLDGCAQMPQTFGTTPSMISICRSNEPIQLAMDMAQAHCRKYGKNAELVTEGASRCTPAGGIPPAPAFLTHFKCVK